MPYLGTTRHSPLTAYEQEGTMSHPITPNPPHATLPPNATSSSFNDRIHHITPPPSSQVPRSSYGKSRTPTPTFSHISTPPPTVEAMTTHDSALGAYAGALSEEEIAKASPEELRIYVTNAQMALSAAKMSAAHYQLQYRMLSQESAATLERMDVEARLTYEEDRFIRNNEQAKAAATSIEMTPAVPDGMIPVQKDLYEHMCRELQHRANSIQALEYERAQQNLLIVDQESQIASLGDRVTLMRERIRESREHIQRHRAFNHLSDATPRSHYSVNHRRQRTESSQQPFAALLQASEMASLAATREPARKGHVRNSISMSSVPTTPQRSLKHRSAFYTPTPARIDVRVPATAPQMRHGEPLRYETTRTAGPPSDGTVSASDNDSEAETEILEENDVDESQASRTASHMLRTSQEDQSTKRDSMKGRGLLNFRPTATKQTKLFGAVRKRNIDRGEEEPESKRTKTAHGIGLGIDGLKY